MVLLKKPFVSDKRSFFSNYFEKSALTLKFKGKWNTTLWIQDPTISEDPAAESSPRWGFELTVWATVDSIHRLPRAEPGEILVAYPVKLTGRDGLKMLNRIKI